MKALFLALSPQGFGETLIALSLADQVASLGVTSSFIVEDHARTLMAAHGYEFSVIESRMGKLACLVIDDVIREFRPDVLVLADYFTYCAVLEVQYRLNPWFIDTYDIPVVTIDIWEWGNTDFYVDIAGDDIVYRASDRFRSLAAHLRPVPLAHFEPDAANRAHPFRVSAGEQPLSRADRRRRREALGVGGRERLVLLPTARWQVETDAVYSKAARGVSTSMPRVVTHYLERLPAQTHFLLIGEVPPAWSCLPADRTHSVPPCSPREFGALLQASDAVLSLNIAATTVWRAVMSGVPAMVLGNRYQLRDEGDVDLVLPGSNGLAASARAVLKEHLPVYPFRMWPLGFYSFLEPLLTANPYTDAVLRAEILDGSGAVEGLTSLLFDPGFRADRLAAQSAYAEKVRALPETGAVFTSMAEEIGVPAR